MKTKKISLANVQGQLSREEMKNIMGGVVGGNPTCNCNKQEDCSADNTMCLSGCTADPNTTCQGYCGCS